MLSSRCRKSRCVIRSFPNTKKRLILDSCSAELLKGHTISMSHHERYPAFSFQKRMVYVHRYLMGFPKGRVVHHRNRNTLDNRIANLKVCTRRVHRHIHCKKRGLFGIYYDTRSKRWMTTGCANNHRWPFGYFTDRIEAALWSDVIDREFGETEALNFADVLLKEYLFSFLSSLRGRIFYIRFGKRTNGKFRRMTAIYNPKGGKKLAFVPHRHNLLCVIELPASQFRLINLDAVQAIRVNHRVYKVYRSKNPG